MQPGLSLVLGQLLRGFDGMNINVNWEFFISPFSESESCFIILYLALI